MTADGCRPGWPPTSRSSIPHTVGSSNRGERRYDLPGGAKRMVMPSRGVRYTIVNGETVYADGALTEARSGQVLRA